YWAAGTSIGDDFPFKEKDLVTGEKLMRKIWNASKLVDQLVPEQVEEPADLDPIDEWMLAELDRTVEFMTDQMNDYGFAKARNRLREFFWHTFCDNYLEIAKQKLDDERNPSTEYVLQEAHQTFLKLFAPFLVHITEEIWHERYGDTSIHLEDWPEPRGVDADRDAGRAAMDVIHALRKYKSEHRMAPTDELEQVEVYGDITGFADAVSEVMHVQELQVRDDSPDVTEDVTGIDLNYERVGPAYGEKVGEIEAALDEDDYTLDSDQLRVAGETLTADEFTVETERTYQGDGEMVETGTATVVVHA
ncbi:MAG: class I tRNA ligase family protein, partial [Candidatus Nanohaloarchaea archaeon]